jgi:ubiquinone/menaquinone biosynthesis C-methylase UbiE
MNEKTAEKNINEYWFKRGHKYLKDDKRLYTKPYHIFRFMRRTKEEKLIRNVLSGLSFKNVLDVGCGYGRVIKLIQNQSKGIKIKGIDLSPHQIERARKYVQKDDVELSVGTVYDINAPDHCYDLVISTSVLMHIPFSRIEKAIGEMIRVSRKYVINIDFYDKDKIGESFGYPLPYQFIHDYTSIYTKMGANKVEMTSCKDWLNDIPFIGKNLGFQQSLFLARS